MEKVYDLQDRPEYHYSRPLFDTWMAVERAGDARDIFIGAGNNARAEANNDIENVRFFNFFSIFLSHIVYPLYHMF